MNKPIKIPISPEMRAYNSLVELFDQNHPNNTCRTLDDIIEVTRKRPSLFHRTLIDAAHAIGENVERSL